jgi:hypothetical protein
LNTLKTIDWEAVAGITAAVLALVLHLVHVAEESVLLAVALVILALILLRDLRREAREDETSRVWRDAQTELQRISAAIQPPDVLLIGPRRLRVESERFAQRARGEQIWFNVCLLMFAPQSLFDALLMPAIENPHVTSIQFLLDVREKQRWDEDVMPKVLACHGREKVKEPRWAELAESSSFILTETERGPEAHLSFWGEPFMSRTPGGDLPRYVFHVQPHSELIGRLDELARRYRLPSRLP